MERVASVYNVFVASPGQLDAQRNEICRVIREYNQTHWLKNGAIFQPVRWECVPAAAGRPQDLINEKLEESDFFLLVMRDRFGSPTGNEHGSGSKEEITRAQGFRDDDEKPMRDLGVFFYDYSEPAADDEQAARVKEFREELDKAKQVFYHDVKNDGDLCERVRQCLDSWIQSHRKNEQEQLQSIDSLPDTHTWRYWTVVGVILTATLAYLVALKLRFDTENQLLPSIALVAVNLLVLIGFRPRFPQLGLPQDAAARVHARRYVEWFQWASMSSLVIATAVAYSLWSMLATIAVPPRGPDQGNPAALIPLGELEPARPGLHMLLLVIGVVVVAFWFTLIGRKRDLIPGAEINYRVGFLGFAVSGLIGLAISLPYSWSQLQDPVPWAQFMTMASWIIVLRIAIFPIIGFLTSILTYRLLCTRVA